MMDARRIELLLKSQFPYEPTDEQEELIHRLSLFLVKNTPQSLFLLKGYAGTGKTTIVSNLVKILPRLGKNTVLLAPTGRAAKVLSNYSGKRAYTIHKKIYRPKTAADGTVHLSLMPNPHTDALFIVDEASMVPNVAESADAGFFSGRNLLEDLFHYIYSGENCNLLMLGDVAQLPPVGLSISPALDSKYLSALYNVKIEEFELTEVVRQAKQSGILMNATIIRDKLNTKITKPPFFQLADYNDVTKINGNQLEELLHYLYGKDNIENAAVITRSNKRANLFNKGIRNKILFREEEISTGDYLMVVRNNYFWLPAETRAGFIANGDMIELLSIRKHIEIYGFRYVKAVIRLIDYPEEKDLEVLLLLDTLASESAALSVKDNSRLFNAILEDYQEVPSKRHRLEKVRNNPYYNALQVKFAYALTCHKTQGGQWRNVIVDQGYLTDEMINIEYLRWLYTAVTRTTRHLYLLNFKEEFFG